MCGIAGFWKRTGRVDDPLLTARRMAETLRQRGPDDDGEWSSPTECVGLSHRRLSVLDISALGHQPMVSEDGGFTIVYNGEIYNFRELRKELEEEGHRFKTGTDTEVVLAAYRKYGVPCLERFNGMFAFALWDENRKVLFLARDRFGVKPLVYYQKDGLFAFGSEIKAIKALGDEITLSLNLPAIRRYFYLTYVLSPETAYREILQLEAGHYMLVTKEGVTCDRWYDLSPHFNAPKLTSRREGETKLRETMQAAVEARLVSDVPLGAFLSGGVDSSIIVGIVARNLGRKIRTFTVGVRDSRVYDESVYAREVADRFGTDHTEIMVSVKDGLAVIPEVLDYFDTPFGDSSAVPTYLLSRELRRSVTVALSGDGGDEVFAGYAKYIAESYSKYFRYLPPALLRFMRQVFSRLPEGRQTMAHEVARIWKKFLRAAESDQVIRHCALMFPVEERLLGPLVGEDGGGGIRDIVAGYMGKIGKGNVDRALFTDMNICLKDDMLVKVDRMGMANSLEVRNPFLDYRVVELAARMPGDWKLKGARGKHILKMAFRDLLPPSIMTRPKRGFGVPVGEWFRDELKGLFEEVVSRNNVDRAGILDYEAVREVFMEHLSAKRDATPLLWSIFAFQWWANRNL